MNIIRGLIFDWTQRSAIIIDDRTEMCLSYDEKPLLVFQKLKNADKNPVFVLKHVKDIPSPIAAVQQRRLTQATSRHVSTEAKSRNQDLASGSATRTPVEDLRSLLGTIIPASTGRGSKREMPPPLAVVSYAIAVYPYAAEQEDELNVAVYVCGFVDIVHLLIHL